MPLTIPPPSHGTCYPHYGLDTDASLRIPCLTRAPPPVTVTLDPNQSLNIHHQGIDKHPKILYTRNMAYTERTKNEQRTRLLQVRLSPDEKLHLQQIANARGLTLSALIRTLVARVV